jgi:hypothetical protein
MKRYVVDTNVPIIANGRQNSNASIDCRIAAVTFLRTLLSSGKILVDRAGDIQAEYRRHLNAKGEPGVGDRFYQEVLKSTPRRTERIKLPKRADGEYVDLPQALVDAGFDRSDRKFAALGKREKAPVVNATDGDWLEHHAVLERHGIQVEFVCGCDASKWFVA